jgi:hypothetical protein
MQRAHGKLGIGAVDKDRDLDLGRRDGRMLMDFSASALNASAATPAWLRMPMPMTDTLASL